MDWDRYFITLCYLVALKSKDERTKYGAVIVGPDNEIRSSGYNSFPRDVNDFMNERQERPEKYFWIEHAERNAIYNAARVGVPLKGTRIYVQGIPCMDCARAIVQSGIKEVIVHNEWTKLLKGDIWIENAKRTEKLFSETKVYLRYYEGKISEIYGFLEGNKIVLESK